MKTEPIRMERLLNAPIERIWKALTDKDEMKEWYFDIPWFEPRLGFEFHFQGGTEDRVYLHLCRITEVKPMDKLAYSWRYEGHTGISYLTFELTPEGDRTRLKLTHEGLETFPDDNPDFARESFEQGWNYIIGTSLPAYLEKKRR